MSTVTETRSAAAVREIPLLAMIALKKTSFAGSGGAVITSIAMIACIKKLISKGRLPISVKNVKSFSYKNTKFFEKLVRRKSKDADLVILGFTPEHLDIMEKDVFLKHPKLQETLFVMAGEDIYIT